ncbi:head-to-tail connector protein [Enterobacter phage 04_vB_Eclo_IJM]|nr:head-to-tail connector protein [Enterobacter phage 04_vB_Eclo_IJM]
MAERQGFAAEGAKAVYDRLKNGRQPYEARARNCAAVTIPSCSRKSQTTPQQSIRLRGRL